jgi:hypothetical protein
MDSFIKIRYTPVAPKDALRISGLKSQKRGQIIW